MHSLAPSLSLPTRYRTAAVDSEYSLLSTRYRFTGPDLAGGRPGPSGVFGISERDWLSNYGVLKIEGFGGRPPVGGRPGARGPRATPLNPALPLQTVRYRT